MKLGCGALLLSSWGLKSHLARRSPPLIAEHRPTLYVKHGGGFGAAAPCRSRKLTTSGAHCHIVILCLIWARPRQVFLAKHLISLLLIRRHINDARTANDLGWNLAILHAWRTGKLTIGPRIRHHKTVLIWHFNAGNGFVTEDEFIINHVTHIKNIGNNLIGFIVRQ